LQAFLATRPSAVAGSRCTRPGGVHPL